MGARIINRQRIENPRSLTEIQRRYIERVKAAPPRNRAFIRAAAQKEAEKELRAWGFPQDQIDSIIDQARDVGVLELGAERQGNPRTEEQVRDELRLKQDFLLMLAANAGFPDSFRITDHPGAPALSSIRKYIYPDWEHTIDQQIRELASEQRIGVPDFFRLAARAENPAKSPPEMSAAEINKQLDRLDAAMSKVNRQFIEEGRGHERMSEILEKTDPLSRRYQELDEEYSALRREVHLRYGPGAPSRLPRGFGPIRRYW